MNEQPTPDAAATEARLGEIRGRIDKATKGPWTVKKDVAVSPERRLVITTPDPRFLIDINLSSVPYDPKRQAINLDAFGEINDTAQMIAHAPQDLAMLLALVATLRPVVAAAELVVESASDAKSHHPSAASMTALHRALFKWWQYSGEEVLRREPR